MKNVAATNLHRKSGVRAENGIFRMLLPFTTALIVEKAIVGFAILSGPRTPRRTWGTRPIVNEIC